VSTSETEYVTATEAARLLDVSKGKMAKLLSSKEIPYISDPRNERAKLIKRADIDAWLAKAPRPKVPHRRRNQQTIGEQQSA
jgi:excisionase family DNA binding protein